MIFNVVDNLCQGIRIFEVKDNSVQFLCKVSQLEEPLIFDFKDSNTLTKVIDYIKDHDDLKPLLRHTIDERTERRKTKGTYRQGRQQ